MPVRDRDGQLTGEQRHLDASVISPAELDVPLGGEALQLRVMCLETIRDPFQPGPGRRAVHQPRQSDVNVNVDALADRPYRPLHQPRQLDVNVNVDASIRQQREARPRRMPCQAAV